MKILLLSGLFAICTLGILVYAQDIAPPPPIIAQVKISTQPSIISRIYYYADKYDVSEYLMESILKCESNLNPKAVGDNGTSYGLAQIHLPAHTNISKDNAEDIEFSLDFIAHNLSEGNEHMWSCYEIVNKR